MSLRVTGVQVPGQEYVPSPALPEDHVLSSGSVLFPGAFDQHGCPLVIFPVDKQDNFGSVISKEEVVDFVNYFLCLHKKKQDKNGLVSVVADLRNASATSTTLIAETVLLLELQQRTIHTVYIIQPRKKEMVKLLLRLLARSCTTTKKVLLKEVSQICNYIDRSQLTAALGGYLVYCHNSWVSFIKEIHGFDQEFVSVVLKLPRYISRLQALSRLPLPSNFTELQNFCFTNESIFEQLRRELGLDNLLTHCENVLEKLRHPEKKQCYQAMAGTALFTQTSFDMLQNQNRIVSALEKVEQLWQQAFMKARLQLNVFQLREDALQVTELIEIFLQKKLQPYKMEISKDPEKASKLVSDFETSLYSPALTLVRRAEDVIHTLSEMLFEFYAREVWVLDLERLKEKLHSTVHAILQTLKTVTEYHRFYNKASRWHTLVLCENFLHELLASANGGCVSRLQKDKVSGTLPVWRQRLSSFLKKYPPPELEELVHLAHLSNTIPDHYFQHSGKLMSQRCKTLRKLLIASGPVEVVHLQLALKWQYELLRNKSSPKGAYPDPSFSDFGIKSESSREGNNLGTSTIQSGTVLAQGKMSVSSFNSGRPRFLQLEPHEVTEDPSAEDRKPCIRHPQDHQSYPQEKLMTEENPSRASIQIMPKVTDSLDLKYEVNCAAAPLSNPWLSLPLDNLENSHTATNIQNATPLQVDLQLDIPSEPSSAKDETIENELMSNTCGRGPQSREKILQTQSSLEDFPLSPIHKVLSSTITDGPDHSGCSTEGFPTLLWDSYDLHNQSPDLTESVVDFSLQNWDIKEQEELKEVEKILGSAQEILEEEESVLVQEALLDALVRSEENHWPAWDSEERMAIISSSDLADAGVLSLEGVYDPASRSSEESLTLKMKSAGETMTPDLLMELKKVHDLDDQIMEENVKLNKFRQSEENVNIQSLEYETSILRRSSVMKKEREAFRERLQKEKREVEMLESSLKAEHKTTASKVVKLSIMEKTLTGSSEDRALCDLLMSVSKHSSTKKGKNPPELDASESEVAEAEGSPDTLHRTVDQDGCADYDLTDTEMVFIPTTSNSDTEGPLLERILPQDKLEPEPSGTNYSSDSPILPDTRCKSGVIIIRTLTAVNDDFESEVNAINCPETVHSSLTLLEFKDCEKNMHHGIVADECCSDDNLSSQHPDDGAFGTAETPVTPPVPMPRRNPVPGSGGIQEKLHGDLQSLVLHRTVEEGHAYQTELSSLTSGADLEFVLNPNELINNNNNNSAGQQVDNVESADGFVKSIDGTFDSLVNLDESLNEKVKMEFGQDDGKMPAGDLQNGYEVLELMKLPPVGSGVSQALLDVRTTTMSEYSSPIVLDTGSGLVKAGLANQDLPSVIFPTIIGQPKYEEVMNGSFERDTYIGHEAQHMRGVLALRHPVKNGIVCNWDEMEKIWHHAFQQLRVDPEDHPVMLTEPAMNPLNNRQRTVEVMFESLNVPYCYMAMQSVLALYSTGRCTGVVLESGDGVSHSVPVFDGYSLPHAIQRLPLAGRDVTLHLRKLLQEQGLSLNTSAELEIVREMKEKCCCVALDYKSSMAQGGPSNSFTMPDGQTVTLDTERFRAPEILFKPELIGRDHCGMHESVYKSVLGSDIDLRRCLLENVVLSGGNTLLEGLPERLQSELEALVPGGNLRRVCVSSQADRDFSVWKGGAVLATMQSFCSAWISMEEYQEYGPQIVLRKCF